MKKAILVGNGFTAKLIKSYKNDIIIKEFYKRNPQMIDRIEERFSIFRYLDLEKNELYYVTKALFCGDDLICGNNVYPSDDGIHITKQITDFIIEKLKKSGFREPEKIFEEYFKNYGLFYEINKRKIEGIETYLKVVHMFMEVGCFTKQDYDTIKDIADNIILNDDKHGLNAIDNPDIDISKLISEINKFTDVYTTNYDTLLDDILERNHDPHHLHGGIKMNFNIWGFSPDSKSDFKNSPIIKYYDLLEESEYDEIYILGFSGENDGHINRRIKNNSKIKKVIVYVNPEEVNELEKQVKSRILFGGSNKVVNLKSWEEFWGNVTK